MVPIRGLSINNVRTWGEERDVTYLIKFIKEQLGEGVQNCTVRVNVIYEWPDRTHGWRMFISWVCLHRSPNSFFLGQKRAFLEAYYYRECTNFNSPFICHDQNPHRQQQRGPSVHKGMRRRRGGIVVSDKTASLRLPQWIVSLGVFAKKKCTS